MPAFRTMARGSVLLAATAMLLAKSAPLATANPSASEAMAIAQEAYIYLYPLITMDVTRKQLTNMEPGAAGLGGPPNEFDHIRTYPAANMRAVVRPNFDTLYSSAWLDLTKGPIIVSVPDTSGRYYLLPMLDMWTDVFAVPGKRTSGTGPAQFAVVPPGWSGNLPEYFQRIEAPTPYVWVIGRTQTNGTSDYAAVNKIQDGYKITPLSDWGRVPATVAYQRDPAVDVKTPPLKQVNTMPAQEYFKYGAELMKLHPPHETDWSVVARMKRIGLEPGKSFDTSKVDPAVLSEASASALELLHEKIPTIARVVNGWSMNTDTMGVYGNYYLKRAIVAMIGLGANQTADAVYPLCIADADGKPLDGSRKYILHFEKSELPPVDAFWSVTMYDAEGFQVANALDRFAIGDRDDLEFNEDGSLDLYIQSESPGAEKEANWLPSPDSGALGVTMRLYAPKAVVTDGRWAPPAVRRVESAAEGGGPGASGRE